MARRMADTDTLEDLQMAFQMLDRDGSGFIEEHELKARGA